MFLAWRNFKKIVRERIVLCQGIVREMSENFEPTQMWQPCLCISSVPLLCPPCPSVLLPTHSMPSLHPSIPPLCPFWLLNPYHTPLNFLIGQGFPSQPIRFLGSSQLIYTKSRFFPHHPLSILVPRLDDKADSTQTSNKHKFTPGK